MNIYSHFQPFGTPHLLAMLCIGALAFFADWLAKKEFSRYDRLFRWTLALILLGNEFYLHVAALQAGDWRMSWALPLHLCDLSLFVLVAALLRHLPVAWELAFYWGLGGSTVAVVTPDLPLAFPHYSFITFFVHHGGIVVGTVYLALNGAYSLPFSSISRVWVITHLYVFFISLFNVLMGTNYLFLCAKPSQPSIIDYLGPWPWYLVGLEGIFVAVLFLLYGLFHLIDKTADTGSGRNGQDNP